MYKTRKGKLLDTKTLVGSSLLTGISIILTRVFSVYLPIAGLPTLRIGFGEIPLIIIGIIFGPLAGGLSGAVADLLGVVISPQGGFFPGFTISSILWGTIPGIIYILLRKRKSYLDANIINTSVIAILVIGVAIILFKNGILTIQNNKLHLYTQPVPVILLFICIAIILAYILLPTWLSRKGNQKLEIYSFSKILFTITIPYLIISLGLNTLWLSIMYNEGYIVFLPGRILAGLIVIPLHAIIVYTLSKFFKHIEGTKKSY